MAVTLYVEQLNSDKSIGFTKNIMMMLENASRIKAKKIDNVKDLEGLVVNVGRYILLITADLDGSYAMMFMDFKNDKRFAIAAMNQLFSSEDAKKTVLKNFDDLSANYKKNYNNVQLEIGEGFASNVSAN